MSSNPKWKHLMNWKETWNGFDKNPENINRNWRPRKWISLVNAELKEKWYEPATKADIEENYMALLQLEEIELKKLLEDKSKPMLIRILVKNMLWWKWFDIIEKMLDRWIWKAIQKSEVDTNVKWSLETNLNEDQMKLIANRVLNGKTSTTNDTESE